MKKLILILTLSLFFLYGVELVTQAYQIDPSYRPINSPFDLKNEIKEQGASGATVLILQIIAGALLYFATPLATIMVAWAAFSMVMGGTEQEKLDQSKKHLTWTILGLILIILSYSAVRIVISIVVGSAEAVSE